MQTIMKSFRSEMTDFK